MSRIAKSIVAFTVLVLDVGGLFAAFGDAGRMLPRATPQYRWNVFGE